MRKKKRLPTRSVVGAGCPRLQMMLCVFALNILFIRVNSLGFAAGLLFSRITQNDIDKLSKP